MLLPELADPVSEQRSDMRIFCSGTSACQVEEATESYNPLSKFGAVS